MRNGSWRVCVWYQCQGVCVCFCAQPAVSLNNPTCLGPPMIHSLSGNLQYHGEIKRSVGGLGGGMMKRYNLVDPAYCGCRIPLINPPLLSWRAVYREGEWGKSCAGCFEEGGLRLDSDTHNNKSPRLSLVLHGSGLSKFHLRVLGKCGISCMTAWLLCNCTSSPATSALTLLTC